LIYEAIGIFVCVAVFGVRHDERLENAE
jgi:hypothetical protein